MSSKGNNGEAPTFSLGQILAMAKKKRLEESSQEPAASKDKPASAETQPEGSSLSLIQRINGGSFARDLRAQIKNCQDISDPNLRRHKTEGLINECNQLVERVHLVMRKKFL